MKFEWDPNKERMNIQKHGVSFEDASYVLADPHALNKYDDEHSDEEDRWVLLDRSLSQIILVVIHTFQDEEGSEYVRIVSARKATKGEQQTYEQGCPK
jgi:uncharacterized protein